MRNNFCRSMVYRYSNKNILMKTEIHVAENEMIAICRGVRRILKILYPRKPLSMFVLDW